MSKLYRAQVLLEPWQHDYLKAEAQRMGTSISKLLRDVINQWAEARVQKSAAHDPIMDIIGIGAGDGSGVARDHDRHLYREDWRSGS